MSSLYIALNLHLDRRLASTKKLHAKFTLTCVTSTMIMLNCELYFYTKAFLLSAILYELFFVASRTKSFILNNIFLIKDKTINQQFPTATFYWWRRDMLNVRLVTNDIMLSDAFSPRYQKR